MRESLVSSLTTNLTETFGILSGWTAIIGLIGSAIITAPGGWDYFLQALIIFMCVDYVTGMLAAAVFKKSKKTVNGALQSCIGFEGFLRKAMMLIMVLIAFQLDNIIGWDFVRHAVIIAFLINELISITENAGLMGVPIPSVLQKTIDVLKKKVD